MVIELSRTYTLPGARDVYQAQELPQRGLFLRDLNRSRVWMPLQSAARYGYAEGFLVEGGALVHFGFDIVAGHDLPWGKPQPTDRRVSDLTPCRVEVIVIDMIKWNPQR